MEQNIVQSLIESKKLAVIKLFVAGKDKQLYLAEIAKNSKVPIATTYRIIKKLVELNIVRQTKISRFTVYQLEKNEKVGFLESILRDEKKIIEEFIGKIRDMDGMQRILLHGKETYNKASIIIIGSNLDVEKIKLLANEYKQNYKFIFVYLVLTEEQFQQMKALGLFSREIRLLFDRSL